MTETHMPLGEISAKGVYEEFMRIKHLFDKEGGRVYTHGTISFHRDESISEEQVLEFAKCAISEIYPNHQSIVVVHTDVDITKETLREVFEENRGKNQSTHTKYRHR